MTDLTDVTLIIPLKIENESRESNVKVTLGYLNHHFKTNVILHESITNKRVDLSPYPNLKFKHIEKPSEPIFHRTKYLNEMLDLVDTPVVANYDIDVIFKPENYVAARFLIRSNQSDFVYPFGLGEFQKRVHQWMDKERFLKTYSISDLNHLHMLNWNAKFGHCIFFKTDIYRKLGGENENFESWGPEDSERNYRFLTMGCRQFYYPGWVYHLEHDRSPDSDITNPYYAKNNALWDQISSMNKEQISAYYKLLDYYKKYTHITFS